jgi:MFS family permease
MYASETSPPHKRGALIMIEGLLITGGIFMAYVLDLAFFFLDPNAEGGNSNANPATASASWRVPIAFQLVLCIPTLLVIWMPESPRWLMLKGNETEARNVIAALDEIPVDDPEVDLKIKEMRESLEISKDVGVKDLFRQGPERNFHRSALGVTIQMFQQSVSLSSSFPNQN